MELDELKDAMMMAMIALRRKMPKPKAVEFINNMMVTLMLAPPTPAAPAQAIPSVLGKR